MVSNIFMIVLLGLNGVIIIASEILCSRKDKKTKEDKEHMKIRKKWDSSV